MSDKLLGTADVFVDGDRLLTNIGVSYQLAGDEGKEQMGNGGLNGVTYTPVPGIVECTIDVSDATDLDSLQPGSAADINVLVKGDAGGFRSFPHASQLTPIKATAQDGGKVPLKFVAATSPKVSGS